MIFKSNIAILLVMLVLVYGCKSQKSDASITIAVAANMKPATDELVKKFETNTGSKCELVVGSSGKLMAQIKAGAPFDIFLSADMEFPRKLFAEGFSKEPPKVYAIGQLVLWSNDTNEEPSLSSLIHENARHIALGNAQTAPYGRAAMEVLENARLFDSVRNKLVYGESISQVNQFLVSGAAEFGFTAKSVVLSEEFNNKGTWVEIDTSLYAPIEQGALLLNHENGSNTSELRFYEYLFSPEAKQILQRFGYSVNE